MQFINNLAFRVEYGTEFANILIENNILNELSDDFNAKGIITKFLNEAIKFIEKTNLSLKI